MGTWTISELIDRLLAACGAISIFGGAFIVIRRWLNPAFKFRKRVDDLEKKQKAQEMCNEGTNKLLEEIVNTNKLLCRSMIVLLDHSITGNGIENIKQVKSDLLNYLTEK